MRVEVTLKKKTKECHNYWKLFWKIAFDGTGEVFTDVKEIREGIIHFVLQADNLEELTESVLSTVKEQDLNYANV